MQVYLPWKAMYEELDAYNSVKYFPWLNDRLDALKEIRETQRDMYRISNHGRQVLAKHGPSYRRIGSLPMTHVMELIKTYGNEFMYDEKLQAKFFNGPGHEWATVDRV